LHARAGGAVCTYRADWLLLWPDACDGWEELRARNAEKQPSLGNLTQKFSALKKKADDRQEEKVANESEEQRQRTTREEAAGKEATRRQMARKETILRRQKEERQEEEKLSLGDLNERFSTLKKQANTKQEDQLLSEAEELEQQLAERKAFKKKA
jgi:hypothetical protein